MTLRSENAPSGRGPAVALLIGLVFLLALLSDPWIAHAAQHLPAAVIRLGTDISRFGLSGYMLVISGLLTVAAGIAVARGHQRLFGTSLRVLSERAAYFFAVVALSGIVAQIIKHLLGRSRPRLIDLDGPYHLDPLSLKSVLASFPSGHSTTVFAAAFVLSCYRPRARPYLYAVAVVIALSRIVVGAHYPSDVVGGATLGTMMAIGLGHVFARRGIALEGEWPHFRPIPDPLAAGRRGSGEFPS